jgi:hypothetical protein
MGIIVATRPRGPSPEICEETHGFGKLSGVRSPWEQGPLVNVNQRAQLPSYAPIELDQ